MTKNRQALIAINEALQALNNVPPDTDVDVGDLFDVTCQLLEARRKLGAPDFPELQSLRNHPLAAQLWFQKHEADQLADGRL